MSKKRRYTVQAGSPAPSPSPAAPAAAPASSRPLDLYGLLAAACLAAFILYTVFYRLAPWIWARNEPLDLERTTLWTRFDFEERDGVESLVLYAAWFLTAAATGTLWKLAGSKRLRMPILAAGAGAFVALAATVGWHLPSSVTPELFGPWILLFTLAVTAGWALASLAAAPAAAAVCLAALPACLIGTYSLSWPDAGFLLAPALRLAHGVPPSQVYMQYDFFLTSIAFVLSRLHLDVSLLKLFGQLSNYALIVGLYFFARAMFRDRGLAAWLFLLVFFVKGYAGLHDPAFLIQVTSLRLDLWLLLAVLVWTKGPFHWTVGTALAVLIFFHKTFGLIYTAAYVEGALLWTALDFLDARRDGAAAGFSKKRLKELAMQAVQIAAALGASALVFGVSNAAMRYQKIGLGFLRVPRDSLYWYAFALFPAALALFVRHRRDVPARYFHAATFVILASAGNSLYYFGRSHENNLIHIAPVLFFSAFLFADLLRDRAASADGLVRRYGRAAAMGAIVAGLWAVTFWYQEPISERMRIQWKTATEGNLITPNSRVDVEAVRAATGGDPKVYFATFKDALFQEQGGYEPVGYFSPFMSWVFQDELTEFLRGLLEKGYWIVADKKLEFVLRGLPITRSDEVGDFRVVKG
ncbi:MAG TPA: hypothetical protein VL404_06845 [Candidatus Eisenbacteria bacterium]|nr:hypothetical protein [Candidatus Eisenbacteria bacterium]